VILSALAFLGNHLAQASEDHTLLEQAVMTQAVMAELVAELADRAKAEDAKLEQIRELCIARKLDDRDLCAEAGIDLP
jgi:hypothetical protein